ncbi:hypothetical protein SS1G_03601 [Sclerotinia sclerotiorum 1980 UF-70]|uniref:Micro-fibrillar-associated protein 1 C-terminal domain-containing protein n=2 Tax=Sclerotinia sclerotiorum (strain ATCC 18683 / 1980 / Ss-1) TaxID=665079 RepID=A7EE61_SCLS1|nr:hypothetical protein SS1G_03601 [Sclerotinia sclerotiorum 1980 UF-70]APA10772.1 hypothetical protein sscle_07g055420 [Sclerotinia sclerotiorum 1980 UF-70]EDO01127.1 hypothetical protein SS1G_03601 [Sclerotinia sclerotiorum 1980 UF-70]
MSGKRMTANPIKPSRYRPGKAHLEEDDSSDSGSDVEETSTVAPPPKASTAIGISSSSNKVDLNERRKAAAFKENARIQEEKALKAAEEEGFVTEEESEEEEGSEEGSDEDSDEEESSEEEAPRKVMMRPIFIKKDKRNNLPGASKVETKTEDELAEAEEARRKKLADEIVEEQIRKDIAAREAGKKNWDDEEEEDEVDDTDDIDPEAELAAWKLRELKRIKRDREAIEEKEKELEEVERRKNLTEEERKREDDEYIAKQKEEREGRGKMATMQKYYHKGAFYSDALAAEGLDKRDIMGSRYADDVQNRELLPKALQMRDMTKLGKKGATKYRDLKSEDTGRWGNFDDRGPKRGGMGMGGPTEDERFMPDKDRGGASGANNVPVGDESRRKRQRFD